MSFWRFWYRYSPLTLTWSLHDDAPLLSRFPACLINHAVFLDKPDSTLSGRYREPGTTDQVHFPNWLRFLLKVSLSFQCDTCAAFCPELSGVSLFGFSFRMTVAVATICRQFWTTSVRAFTHANIAGFSVLGTSTAKPEHPSVSKKICIFDWPNSASGTDSSGWTSTCGTCWSVNFSTRCAEHSRAVSGWHCLKVSPDFSGFLRNLQFYSRTSSLSLVMFALSTTASIVSLFGVGRRLPSAARALVANKSLSTADARVEQDPVAIQK